MEADGEGGIPVRPLETVLIVEDDGLISLMLEELVREEGARRVHACRDEVEALRIAREESVDCAILDISFRGTSSYEVADALAARNIPFLFCTGVSAIDIEERHRHRPLLSKPYGDPEFRAVLAKTLGH